MELRTDTCSACDNFQKMSPGHAGICMLQQRGRAWNEAKALVSDDHTCGDYKPNRAVGEMVDGYRDGREASNPEPSSNRSAAYRHGFQSGRNDLSKQPNAPYQQRLEAANKIIVENA